MNGWAGVSVEHDALVIKGYDRKVVHITIETIPITAGQSDDLAERLLAENKLVQKEG